MSTLSGAVVGITGATGMIGRALVAAWEREGASVRTLSRGASGTHRWELGSDEAPEGWVDPAFMEGLDLLIHLAGESIASGRFTAERKVSIRASRIDSMALLLREMARLERRPRMLISASAVGIYGDRGDEILDETDAPGEGFLAELCVDWEAEALKARSLGVRVALGRIGLVLAKEGGLLARLRPIMRAGFGGPLGEGAQWMSPIHLEDLVEAILFIARAELEGPVNLTLPEPLTNREFTRVYGEVLGRPAIMRAPRWALGLMLGKETSRELLFSSQRVRPKALLDAGFEFRYPSVREALSAIEAD